MAILSNLLLHARLPRNDYLIIGLLISLGVHGVALAIRLHAPPPVPVPQKPLEVALVTMETTLAPLNPQLLAQANLLAGSDNGNEGLGTTPLPRTTDQSEDEVVLAALRKRQKELEHEQQRLLEQMESQLQAHLARENQETLLDATEPGTDTRDQESLVLSARIAALKEQIERYNAQPRQRFIGASAQEDVYAHYLEAWRTRIEQLGTEHYPEQARGRIYGSLQLTVHIRQDGTLDHVDIERPSEHAILNLAAQRIVQLAAPFAPLPPDIAKETDILSITRTWNFQNEQLHTQFP